MNTAERMCDQFMDSIRDGTGNPWYVSQARLYGVDWHTQIHYDDCIATYFLGTTQGSSNELSYPRGPFLAENITYETNFNLTYATTGDLYLDENCNQVPRSPEAQLCDSGSLFWRASPISLLWDGQKKLSEDVTFTDFPLIPSVDGKKYLWRASETAPLLVYDPEHKGDIKDAKQLIGNWTFGGKASASLSNGTNQSSSLWRDGYEVLSTFDANQDGSLTSSEIKDLGLWFDYNKNSISEKGEVRTLLDAGVTRLYYKADKKEIESGHTYATLGYEKIENGKTITGSSVDWYTEQGSSVQELISKQILKSNISALNQSDKLEEYDIPTSNSDTSSTSSVSSLVSINSLTGTWEWQETDKNEFAENKVGVQGILFISPKDNGVLSGYTMVESPLDGNIEASIAVNLMRFTGKFLDSQGEKLDQKASGLEFSVVKDNMKISSKATLSEDGRYLNGESHVNMSTGPENLVFSYKWIAKKRAS
jgi:hypothetical protein